MKSFFLWLHRWFGLIGGLYFVLLGLSGSYLVYDEAIDDFRKPELRRSAASSNSFSLSALIESAQKGLATDSAPLRISVPENPQSNASLMFNMPTEQERRRFVTAYVDPLTNQFKGQELRKKTLTGFLFAFHHDLFMGGPGRTIVAILGNMLLLLLLTGLFLWWPKNRNFRKALSLKEMKNFFMVNFELHRFTGFYSLILIILVTVTGIYLSRPDWFTLDRGTEGGGPPVSAGRGEHVDFDFAKIEQVLKEHKMQIRPASLRIDGKSGMINYSYKEGGVEVSVKIDGRKSELFGESKRGGEKSVRAINHDLHAGHFWGTVGKFLIFLSGILPLFFYVTGFVIWLKKPGRRRA